MMMMMRKKRMTTRNGEGEWGTEIVSGNGDWTGMMRIGRRRGKRVNVTGIASRNVD